MLVVMTFLLPGTRPSLFRGFSNQRCLGCCLDRCLSHQLGGFAGASPAVGPVPESRRGHPQHPAPDATACPFAAAPQHLPSAFASATVPQQVLAWTGSAGAVPAGLPQQAPAAPGGFDASAVLPRTASLVVVLAFMSYSFDGW
jgi:hypothetical protein